MSTYSFDLIVLTNFCIFCLLHDCDEFLDVVRWKGVVFRLTLLLPVVHHRRQSECPGLGQLYLNLKSDFFFFFLIGAADWLSIVTYCVPELTYPRSGWSLSLSP